MPMGKCSSCGKTVVWAKTRLGRNMPLDQVPPSEGNIRITNGIVVIGKRGDGPFLSHFATCPQAEQHRKNGHNPKGTAA